MRSPLSHLRGSLAGVGTRRRGPRCPHGRVASHISAGESPEKLTGQAKIDTLAMLDHTSADVAATITEHIVDTKVNNSHTVNRADPTLLGAGCLGNSHSDHRGREIQSAVCLTQTRYWRCRC